MHSAKAEVETSVAPGISRARSYVTRRDRIAPPSPRAIAVATSSHPSSSNIIPPDRITLPGFTLSCPAYLGAVPWVASKTAYPSPTLPPGASPSPPTWAAAASESRSPFRLGAAITEYSSGRSTSCANMASVIRSLITTRPLAPPALAVPPPPPPPPPPSPPGADLALRQRVAAEPLPRDSVAPLPKAALGEFHDVALVHQGHRRQPRVDRMLDRLRDEALRAELGYRLDPDGAPRANLRAEALRKELDDRVRLGAPGLVLDPRVHVFDVLAEDHDVQLLGLPHRTRHAIEVPYGPDTRVEIEDLAQRDIERADPAPDGRRERALDRHPVLPNRLQRGFGEPAPGLAERLLAGEHLQPL